MELMKDLRPATYGANANDPITCSSEHLVSTREFIILRHQYGQCLQRIDSLVKENSALFSQYQTLHMLYIELKYDRNRIARLFNATMRELVYKQRTCNCSDQARNDASGQLEATWSLSRSQRRKRKRRSTKRDHKVDKTNRVNQEQPDKPLSNEMGTISQPLSDLFMQVEPSYCNFENLEDFADIEFQKQQQQQEQQQQRTKVCDEESRPEWAQPIQIYTEFGKPKFNKIIPQYRSNSLSECFQGISKSNLMYPNLLQQCVEFSKSLLNLSSTNSDCVRNDNKIVDNSLKCDNSNNNDETIVEPKSCEMSKDDDTILHHNVEIEEAVPMDVQQVTQTGSLILNFGINPIEQQLRIIKIKLKPNESLGMSFDCALQNGVVVKQVAANSPAEKAEIYPGDRVLEVCGINMREVNFVLADKILKQCNGLEIVIKVLSAEKAHQITDSQSPMLIDNNLADDLISTVVEGTIEPVDTAARDDLSLTPSLKRNCTLTRREAFKKKRKTHAYFERKQAEELMLHQSCHLTVTMPRRINVNMMCLAQIKLLGGNAVGIFVHSIINQYLSNILQTGDQLLEYNNFDLTKATAEDAAIELAKPATDAVLVAYFNIDMYDQIRQNLIGDSFYIRTLFSRPFTNRSLNFQKGDIFYVDNTMYEGKPGYWRAWRVDEYGEHMECGLIPSKYTAECELLKQSRHQEKTIRGFRLFKFLTLFSLSRLFSNKRNGYSKLDEKTRVLASFSYSCVDAQNRSSDESEAVDSAYHIKSYQMVRKVKEIQPRPVLLFGPLSHIVAERMEHEFPSWFRQCTKMATSTEELELNSPATARRTKFLHCTHTGSSDGYQCISLTSLNKVIEQNCHPVIPVVVNTIKDFHQNGIFPIVIGIKFRSARHIKETVNLWDRTKNKSKTKLPKISFKMAKAMFEHMLELENEFQSQMDYCVTGNNLTFMCTKIKRMVLEAQKKVRWVDIN